LTLSLRSVLRRLVFVMLAFCSLLLSWLIALRLLVLLLMCHRLLLRLCLLLLVTRVLVFTVITVVEMDMWRHFATVRRKLRLAVLHRVLVVLVLEDLRSSAGSDTHEILMVALQLLHR
jgi:hypothetical protein